MYFCYFLSGYLGKIISPVPPGPLSGPPSVILWPTQCPPEAFLALPHHRLQCSSWPPTTIPSLQKLIQTLSAGLCHEIHNLTESTSDCKSQELLLTKSPVCYFGGKANPCKIEIPGIVDESMPMQDKSVNKD